MEDSYLNMLSGSVKSNKKKEFKEQCLILKHSTQYLICHPMLSQWKFKTPFYKRKNINIICIRNYYYLGREIRTSIFIHAHVLAMTSYFSNACGILLKAVNDTIIRASANWYWAHTGGILAGQQHRESLSRRVRRARFHPTALCIAIPPAG